MKFAAIWLTDGAYTVMEIFNTPDDGPIENYFAQGDETLNQLFWVNVHNFEPAVQPGWIGTKDNSGAWSFAAYVAPPPTSAEVLASNSAILLTATQLASAQKTALTNRIGTLQDAIELEEATPAEVVELPLRQAQLVEWKRYAIYLGRVTTQVGWHMTVDWPVQPAQGMDLTVSAVSRPTVQAS